MNKKSKHKMRRGKSKGRNKTFRKKKNRGGGSRLSQQQQEYDLFDAVKNGDFDAVIRILDRNPTINVNVKDNDFQRQFNNPTDVNVNVGMTPLFYAVSRNMNHLPIRDQNIEIKDNYYKIAELLIQRGANVNAETTEWFPGWSPIHWAAEYWNLDMVQLLITNGAIKIKTYIRNRVGDTINLEDVFGYRMGQYDDVNADLAIQILRS